MAPNRLGNWASEEEVRAHKRGTSCMYISQGDDSKFNKDWYHLNKFCDNISLIFVPRERKEEDIQGCNNP